MRKWLEGSNLTWPFFDGLPRRPDRLPQLLQDILNWDQDERYKSHNVHDFFGYLILLRNSYKHFDNLPEELKVTAEINKFHFSIDLWQY